MARDRTRHTYHAENGPWGDGPDEVYIRALCLDDAKIAANRVDGFNTAEVNRVDDAPEDATVYDADDESWLLSEGGI